MYILFLFLLSTFSWGANTKEIEEAKKSIKTLIQPLISGTRSQVSNVSGFRLDACDKHKINWADVILMRRSVTLSYKFKTGCDIQGNITPKVLQIFPAELQVQNLGPYKKVETENKITASLEMKPVMMIEMRKGKLSGNKGEVKFEADYQIQINPIADDGPMEKDLGGELRITEIFGSKVDIKEKIRVRK